MDKKKLEDFYLLLQINDTAFPIGAYSHSFGLETYIQKELVRDELTALEYVKRTLLGSFLYTELLSASCAYNYTVRNKPGKLCNLDLILRAVKVAKEIRSASEKLGNRFVKTVGAMDVKLVNDTFLQYCHMGREKKIRPNHSVAYGSFCASVGIDKWLTLSAYIYSSTSAIVTNCVKTVPLGQMAGQKILVECYPLFTLLLDTVYKLNESDIGKSMPGFEIRSMQHETLYSRQYMS